MGKLVECSNCCYCQGMKILTYLVVIKDTGQVIEQSEEVVYQCEFFGVIHADELCYEYKPKEVRAVM